MNSIRLYFVEERVGSIRTSRTLNAMVPRVQSMLMDISLDNRIGLDIHSVTSTIGFDPQRKIGIRINVPEKTAKKPEAPILVTKSGVSCGFFFSIIQVGQLQL